MRVVCGCRREFNCWSLAIACDFVSIWPYLCVCKHKSIYWFLAIAKRFVCVFPSVVFRFWCKNQLFEFSLRSTIIVNVICFFWRAEFNNLISAIAISCVLGMLFIFYRAQDLHCWSLVIAKYVCVMCSFVFNCSQTRHPIFDVDRSQYHLFLMCSSLFIC